MCKSQSKKNIFKRGNQRNWREEVFMMKKVKDKVQSTLDIRLGLFGVLKSCRQESHPFLKSDILLLET